MIDPTPPRPPRSVPPELHLRWYRWVADQHGLLDVHQLARFGVGAEAVEANVAARRWRRVLPRVYALTTGPLVRPARLSAALLYGGPAAVLSHRTAAEEWGMLRRDDGEPVHVTVPYRCSAVSQPPLVVVHRSRAWSHIALATAPPRTSPADTVLDVATAEPTAGDAVRRFVALATRGRVRVLDLRVRLEERRPRRYRTALVGAVDLLASGVQSALEQRYACDVEGAHGLPAGRRQHPVAVDGRTLFEDVVYGAPRPVVVRLDGRAFHDAAEVAFRDRRRDNAAELAGRHRLVYGWEEVDRDACGVAAEVRTILLRAGAVLAPNPCRACGQVVSA